MQGLTTKLEKSNNKGNWNWNLPEREREREGERVKIGQENHFIIYY